MFILAQICVEMGLPWHIDSGSHANTTAGVQTGGLHANTGSIIVRVFCCVPESKAISSGRNS